MREDSYDLIHQNENSNWWFRVRRDIVKRLLATEKQKQCGALRILDVGCGTGLLLLEIEQFGEVTGIDMSERAVTYCKQRGLTNLAVGDATHVPYSDNSFDVVLLLDVLEHVEDDAEAARELARVLAPGGQLIVMVPAFMFLWGVNDDVGHHFRRYTRSQVRAILEKAGLTVTRATYFNTVLFPAIAVVRLMVKAFHIKMKTEHGVGGSFGNHIFHKLFALEARLLQHFSFPFGVSILLIAQKREI
jgi:2-polyprenyl-3-methyl-5-hydroxy-6-metoxy-1,4-benzoquinol methylase